MSKVSTWVLPCNFSLLFTILNVDFFLKFHIFWPVGWNCVKLSTMWIASLRALWQDQTRPHRLCNPRDLIAIINKQNKTKWTPPLMYRYNSCFNMRVHLQFLVPLTLILPSRQLPYLVLSIGQNHSNLSRTL